MKYSPSEAIEITKQSGLQMQNEAFAAQDNNAVDISTLWRVHGELQAVHTDSLQDSRLVRIGALARSLADQAIAMSFFDGDGSARQRSLQGYSALDRGFPRETERELVNVGLMDQRLWHVAMRATSRVIQGHNSWIPFISILRAEASDTTAPENAATYRIQTLPDGTVIKKIVSHKASICHADISNPQIARSTLLRLVQQRHFDLV